MHLCVCDTGTPADCTSCWISSVTAESGTAVVVVIRTTVRPWCHGSRNVVESVVDGNDDAGADVGRFSNSDSRLSMSVVRSWRCFVASSTASFRASSMRMDLETSPNCASCASNRLAVSERPSLIAWRSCSMVTPPPFSAGRPCAAGCGDSRCHWGGSANGRPSRSWLRVREVSWWACGGAGVWMGNEPPGGAPRWLPPAGVSSKSCCGWGGEHGVRGGGMLCSRRGCASSPMDSSKLGPACCQCCGDSGCGAGGSGSVGVAVGVRPVRKNAPGAGASVGGRGVGCPGAPVGAAPAGWRLSSVACGGRGHGGAVAVGPVGASPPAPLGCSCGRGAGMTRR